MLTDARSAALLALALVDARCAVVLADARAAALLALASFAVVLADARPTAFLAPASSTLLVWLYSQMLDPPLNLQWLLQGLDLSLSTNHGQLLENEHVINCTGVVCTQAHTEYI